MSPFEAIMIAAFGVGWPVSIVKTLRAPSVEGKSRMFLAVIFTGYISGIIHKVFFNFDLIIIIYIINACLVGTDLAITIYRKIRASKRTDVSTSDSV